MRLRLTPTLALALTAASTLVMVVADDYLGAVGIVVAVTLSTVGLVVLLDLERKGRAVRISAVVASAAVVLIAAVVLGPTDSHDLWSYAMYGRILSVHHASPWVVTPAHFPTDPFLSHVARGWRHTTSIYGPAFELMAAAITKVGGDAATAVRMLFTSTFALATAAGGVIVFRRTRSSAATALVLLHPAIAVAGILGGHNDVLVGLGLLGAVVFVQDDRPIAAGLSAGLATLVKLTGGIGILALAAWAFAHHGRDWTVRFAGAAFGLVALAYLPFGTSGFSAFLHNRGSLSRASAWEFPRLLTGLDHRHTALNIGLPRSDTQLIITLGTVVMIAIAVWMAIKLRHRADPGTPLVAAIGSYLIFAPYVLPWYPAWVIPTIGLNPRAPVGRLLALQGAALVVVYELKTQSLAGWIASIVWWISVLVSVTLCVVFLRLTRTGEPDPEPALVGARNRYSSAGRLMLRPTSSADTPSGPITSTIGSGRSSNSVRNARLMVACISYNDVM